MWSVDKEILICVNKDEYYPELTYDKKYEGIWMVFIIL